MLGTVSKVEVICSPFGGTFTHLSNSYHFSTRSDFCPDSPLDCTRSGVTLECVTSVILSWAMFCN